jgi:hypothetical protein
MKKVLILLLLCGPVWAGEIIVWRVPDVNGAPDTNGFVAIAGKFEHFLAITDDASAFCWGRNDVLVAEKGLLT